MQIKKAGALRGHGQMSTYLGILALGITLGLILLVPASCKALKTNKYINKHPEKISDYLAAGWKFKTNQSTKYIYVNRFGTNIPSMEK